MPKKPTPAAVFARRLRALMEEKSISGAELARRSGVSQPTISRTLAGVDVPGWNVVVRLANALNVSTEDFR